jgi:hypothetical protein
MTSSSGRHSRRRLEALIPTASDTAAALNRIPLHLQSLLELCL